MLTVFSKGSSLGGRLVSDKVWRRRSINVARLLVRSGRRKLLRMRSAADVAIDFSINLLAGGIGLAIGWSWQRARNAYKQRRARRFWRPFVTGPTQVVVSTFAKFASFEPTGFVPFGDAMAMTEIRTLLDALGAERSSVKYAYADRIDAQELGRSHLIVLGGPDANSVTRRVIQQDAGTIAFGDPKRHEIIFRDRDGGEYGPHGTNEEVEVDIGLIRRIRNPFNSKMELILVAGSFGYGTWGAARYLIEKSNERRSMSADIEWLLQVDVFRSTPHEIRRLIPPAE